MSCIKVKSNTLRFNLLHEPSQISLTGIVIVQVGSIVTYAYTRHFRRNHDRGRAEASVSKFVKLSYHQ